MGNTDNRLVGRIAVSDIDGQKHNEVMEQLFKRLSEPHTFGVGDLIIVLCRALKGSCRLW